MSIDEAIKHAEEIAELNEDGSKSWTRDGWQSAFKNLTPEKEAELKANRVILADECEKCAEEHRQLAEWLKELKVLRKAVRDALDTIQTMKGSVRKLYVCDRKSCLDGNCPNAYCFFTSDPEHDISKGGDS